MHIIVLDTENGRVYNVTAPESMDPLDAVLRVAEAYKISNYEWAVFDGIIRGVTFTR